MTGKAPMLSAQAASLGFGFLDRGFRFVLLVVVPPPLLLPPNALGLASGPVFNGPHLFAGFENQRLVLTVFCKKRRVCPRYSQELLEFRAAVCLQTRDGASRLFVE